MATDKGFFNYWVVENSGKGFITHIDKRKFWIQGYPGDVWVCDDIPESRDWGARNSATTKTKSQAQTIVTNIINDAKDAWDTKTQIDAVISKFNLDPHADISGLSGGNKRRVLIAQTFVNNPDLILLDEPTNHLDIEAIIWLEKFILDYGKSVSI